MKLWRNTLWNLLGHVIPALVVLPAMALMARLLGVEKFGLFMLTFAVLGYAGIFDAGITRAIIRSIAINKGQLEKDRAVMGTALWIVLFLSAPACAFVYFGAEPIVHWLKVTPLMVADANSAFQMTAFVVPPMLLAAILFSYLEGAQQFVKLNVYKAITGPIASLLPALFLFIEPTLTNALIGLLIARVIILIIAYISCVRNLGPNIFSFQPQILRELFAFGSWMTLSNIIGPLMVYFDRFILSNFLGASRVAFYTAPAEAITKLSLIPGALARAIFPLFSENQHKSSAIASQVYKGLFIATIAIALPVFLAADHLLNLWLGDPYGNESAGVFRILLIGFMFNSLAQIPFARIQAHGKAKITAMIHLVELLPYLAVLASLIYCCGIHGAAIAWTLRVTADFFAMEYFSRQLES